MSTLLDLARFRATPLVHEPFEYLMVPAFLRPEACALIHADFPEIEQPGSFPLSQLAYGEKFEALITELRGETVRSAFVEKFDLDLSGRPTMITVRGQCGPRDGRAHVDSVTKIITVLIYLNEAWGAEGGCLRLLGSQDLNDVLEEVSPEKGSLIAFRRSDNSWHGHLPFVGPRRVVQLNWVRSRWVLRRETFRHSLSAFLKGVKSIGLFRSWTSSNKRAA